MKKGIWVSIRIKAGIQLRLLKAIKRKLAEEPRCYKRNVRYDEHGEELPVCPVKEKKESEKG